MTRRFIVPVELWGDYPAQLLAFTRRTEGCWEFTGCVSSSTGYGQMGRNLPAHRVAWEVANGAPIPDGLVIDHTCHNEDHSCRDDRDCRHRRCVNPDHLEAVTFTTNVARGRGFAGINSRVTHCPAMHEYAGDNLITYNGHRLCRACRDIRNRADSAKRTAARLARLDAS